MFTLRRIQVTYLCTVTAQSTQLGHFFYTESAAFLMEVNNASVLPGP